MKQHLEHGPIHTYTPNIYNKSRVELIKDAYRYLPMVYHHNMGQAQKGVDNDHLNIYGALANPHQLPGGVHFGMFVKYIELMGTEEHKRLYFEKAVRCEITGCYAQTEVGHGSDIRSLETTSTYDHTTKEWIINSPTPSSAKYWPGELSFFANHAIVFAQTWIKGKNYGVNPFFVPIKDQDYNWLPGIEGGDIGPKIGFHSKENGYCYFRNVRVPKNNLFTKYA
jgi:alkylation response protein AidB-like acyl-CoA dehydrogenase